MTGYSYFMIRLRHAPAGEAATPPIVGVIERLSSGEKREFDTGGELLHWVTAWTADAQKVQPVPGKDNHAGTG